MAWAEATQVNVAWQGFRFTVSSVYRHNLSHRTHGVVSLALPSTQTNPKAKEPQNQG